MMLEPDRFKRLFIEKLFGEGSHDIDISFGLEARVTALFGRNGSGKTITLALLSAVREGYYEELLKYPLRRFSIETTNGCFFELIREEGMAPLSNSPEVTGFRYQATAPDITPLIGHLHPLKSSAKREISERLVQWSHVIYNLSSTTKKTSFQEPPLLKAFREQLPPVKLIRTDRLMMQQDEADPQDRPSVQTSKPQRMVDVLSAQIEAIVKVADREYRLLSTRLDSTLPQRLFSTGNPAPDLNILKQRAAALREKEQALLTFGLLKEIQAPLDGLELNDSQRGTFAIILGDAEQKLQPFDQVVARSKRLLDSINRKLKPKVIKLDVEKGYRIETATGKPLSLSCLSSGEQHELVLLHEILFDVKPGSLILIDEPELSLHVGWQEEVMGELSDIARLSNVDFVLATHSPYIVGEGDVRMVRLGPAA